MRMLPVKRNYAFENPDVPHGEQYVLKVCVGQYVARGGQYGADARSLPVR
jgi:hypothetical protein